MQRSRTRTHALLALAALLIANSHLEAFYPLRFLAADGLLGNSLFFLLSGFGITHSLDARRSFFGYYSRRILRLYPSLLLVYLLLEILYAASWQNASFPHFLEFVIYPTRYMFLRQIMVFYAVLYFYFRFLKKWVPPKALLALTAAAYGAVYFATYGTASAESFSLSGLSDTLHWLFYFFATTTGVLLAETEWRPTSRFRTAAGAAAALSAYLGIKLAMHSGNFPHYPALLHLIVLPVLVFFFYAFTDQRFLGFLDAIKLGFAARLLGEITWEIYLVHGYVQSDPRVSSWQFPFNVALFFAATLIIAGAVERMSRKIRGLLGR